MINIYQGTVPKYYNARRKWHFHKYSQNSPYGHQEVQLQNYTHKKKV